MASTNL